MPARIASPQRAGESGSPDEDSSHGPPYANNRVLVVDDQAEIHEDFAEMPTPESGKRLSDDPALAMALGQVAVPRVGEGVPPEIELSHAASGEEACALVEEARRSGQPFALAFVDIRMPRGMDGIETVQGIRRIDGDIEVVIMTAYSDRAVGDIVRSAGPLHKTLFVRKPFSREEIQQIAVCLVGKWNVERALADQSRETATANRTLEAVLDATEDAMVMYDGSGRVVFANRTFERLCGHSRADLRGMPPRRLAATLGKRFRKPRATDVEAGFVVGGTRSLVEDIRRRDKGQGLFYRFTAAVNGGEKGETGRLEVYRNVSMDIEVQKMRAEVVRLRGKLEKTHSFGEMVGGSRKMREVYASIRHGASSDATVLVRGETGTGKELVAKSFHANSARKAGPFLAVQCAALPEGLAESKLFGHRKGAFTGAVADRRGAFEQARGGTLFLDEIGDMRPGTQVKLLRVLRDLEFRRVGGTRLRRADVRIIAATNRDLEQAVLEGEFRRDLFHRLSVYPVHVPPLRERREDIPLLADHFLKKHARHVGRSIAGVSTAALQLLLQYDWPGNVRELANIMQRAVLLEASDVLQAGSLPRQLTFAVETGRASARRGGRVIRTLAALEREAVAEAMDISGHNIAAASRGLGINRATLYRKLEKYGLRRRK